MYDYNHYNSPEKGNKKHLCLRRKIFHITLVPNEINGYKYNVQVWPQIMTPDGLFRRCYAGHGRFCKTLEEVNKFINEQEEK